MFSYCLFYDIEFRGGAQQCRSTTVQKKAVKIQNNSNAISKEREFQRKSLQISKKITPISAPKCLQLQWHWIPRGVNSAEVQQFNW